MTDNSMSHSKPPLEGYDLIADYVRVLEPRPGVYRMLDQSAEVLYVGKAKDLKKRVSSYAKRGRHSARIARMIEATRSMMFLTTETETEALLLEQNLIKQLKPKYNVLLRDDKSFPNIVVTADHNFPLIKKHRGAKKRKGKYFGPFASGIAVNRTLNQLQKIFQLRNCSDAMFASRTRPCLQHQIGRCSAPCVGRIDENAYQKSVRDAERFLRGETAEIQKKFADEMQEASKAMEFERAAALRDRIKALTHIQGAQTVNPRTVKEADIISLYSEGGQACVQIFFIRANQNWGNAEFYPQIAEDMTANEILMGFLGQFYHTRESARLILLSDDIEDRDIRAEALSKKIMKRVEIHVPKRGERFELVTTAKRNAQQALVRKVSERATQLSLLRGLGDIFALKSAPNRIEVYDNSHFQGAHSVGAMIVAGPNGFERSQYRKFNINSERLSPGDDFGMMKLVLERRFLRLLKEDPDRESAAWPDLLLIDGGAGQISAVDAVLTDLGVKDIPFVGVAKGVDRDHGKEEFHLPRKKAFALSRNDPVLYYIQRLRDEAHRFAIGAHRAMRKKSVLANPLDAIEGIGASRKRALMMHFGSAKAVSSAALVDIKSVEGISDAVAQRVFDHFNDRS